MENASKALIMAGSVLLAMLIIGALVFSINQISKMQQTEDSVEDAEKLAEFNRQIETFNKQTIYGSELISLSNLIDDYNFRQSDLKGYEPIKFEVKVTSTNRDIITPTTYKNYGAGTKKISDVFTTLEDKVNEGKTKDIEVEYKGETIKETTQKLSGMRNEELKQLVNKSTGGTLSEEDINNFIEKLREKGNEYTIFNSELVNFKSSKFKRISFEYDQGIGRVIYISFEEES